MVKPVSSLEMRLLRGDAVLPRNKDGNFQIPIDTTGAPFVRCKANMSYDANGSPIPPIPFTEVPFDQTKHKIFIADEAEGFEIHLDDGDFPRFPPHAPKQDPHTP